MFTRLEQKLKRTEVKLKHFSDDTIETSTLLAIDYEKENFSHAT